MNWTPLSADRVNVSSVNMFRSRVERFNQIATESDKLQTGNDKGSPWLIECPKR